MNTKKATRREFLRMSGLAVAGMAVAACAQPTPTPVPPTQAPAAPAPTAVPPTKAPAPTAVPPTKAPAPTAVPPTAVPTVKKPVTIQWWTEATEDFSEEAQRKMVNAFHAAQKDVKVEITVLPDAGYSEKMTTTLGAGQGAPDVAFFWTDSWLPAALDLAPLIAKEKFDTGQYIKGFYDTHSQYKGTTVTLPLGVGANFVMYNSKVFDEAKVAYPDLSPDTAEWLKMIVKLNDPTKKRWGGDRPRGPYRAIWLNFGARMYSDDGKKVEGYLNGPGSQAAYEWFWDLVQTGATPTPADIELLGTQGTGPIDLWMAGRLATATLNGGHMLKAMKEGVPFGIVREPGPAGKPRYVNAWSLATGIWKGTKEPEAAWTFLKYWAGAEGQKFLMQNANLFPSIKSVLSQYPKANEPYVKAFFQVLEDNPVRAITVRGWSNTGVTNAVKDLWDNINLGKIKREEIKPTLDKAVPAAQKALDEARAKVGL